MYRRFARYAPLAALMVVLVLMAGCSGGYGPTLPSPDGGDVGPPPPPPPAGQFCVNVQSADGHPLANAYVSLVKGAVSVVVPSQENWGPVTRTATGADGRACFDDLASGQYALVTAANGLATDHRIMEISSEDSSVTVILDNPVEVSPTECPILRLDDPSGTLDQDAGTATVSGTVQNTDSDSIVVFHNGDPNILGLASDGSFSQVFFLAPGVNTFRALAGNAACTVRDPEQEWQQVLWRPSEGGDFVFRVTLTWNEATDADLHTWAPNLSEHSYWSNKSISGGQLDRDEIQGFGPENFTATRVQEGRWRIAIHSYSIHDLARYDVNVRVMTGGLAANSLNRTFGPHSFTTSGGGAYPVAPPSWWRPVDIIVAADGTVSLASPDDTVLGGGLDSASMLRK